MRHHSPRGERRDAHYGAWTPGQLPEVADVPNVNANRWYEPLLIFAFDLLAFAGPWWGRGFVIALMVAVAVIVAARARSCLGVIVTAVCLFLALGVYIHIAYQVM